MAAPDGETGRVPKFCIVLRGPAGAGKSALAKAVQRELHRKVAVIDTDIFNWQIVPGEDDKDLVFDNVLALVANYLRRDCSVIVEGLIITSEERGAIARLRELAASCQVVFLDFYCSVPKELARQRSIRWEKEVSDELIQTWWDLAEDDKKNVPWRLNEIDMRLDVDACATHVLESIASGGRAAEGDES